MVPLPARVRVRVTISWPVTNPYPHLQYPRYPQYPSPPLALTLARPSRSCANTNVNAFSAFAILFVRERWDIVSSPMARPHDDATTMTTLSSSPSPSPSLFLLVPTYLGTTRRRHGDDAVVLSLSLSLSHPPRPHLPRDNATTRCDDDNDGERRQRRHDDANDDNDAVVLSLSLSLPLPPRPPLPRDNATTRRDGDNDDNNATTRRRE